MALNDVLLFNYYRRYRWRAQDFTALQATLIGYSKAISEGLSQSQGAILKGFDYVSATGLDATISAGIAFGPTGQLLVVNENTPVSILPEQKTLIVARPVELSINNIPNPTDPFSEVFLNTTQQCNLISLVGSGPDYPAKGAGDVIICGVTTDATDVTDVDYSVSEVLDKQSITFDAERTQFIVGNKRFATHRYLQDAIDAASPGSTIRITEDQTVDEMVEVDKSELTIEFDSGVEFLKGTAATGMSISGDRCNIKGGRFSGFSATGNIAISTSGNYTLISGGRFADNETDLDDISGTTATQGVINE